MVLSCGSALEGGCDLHDMCQRRQSAAMALTSLDGTFG
jgi:hypothetical protein